MRALAGAVAGALLLALAGGPPPAAATLSPRLLVGLAATGKPTSVRVTVRNLSARPMSFGSLTRLTLRRVRVSELDRSGGPAYWAPVDLRSARSPETGAPRDLRLGPGESRDLVVDLRDLAWAEGGCACWPDGTLTRVVVPGRYELLVEIEEPDSSFWWRSNSAAAVVKRSRVLEVSFE
jgi:hypothetical protein